MWQLYVAQALAGALVGASLGGILRFDLPVSRHRSQLVIHILLLVANIGTSIVLEWIVRTRLRLRREELRRALQNLEAHRPDALN